MSIKQNLVIKGIFNMLCCNYINVQEMYLCSLPFFFYLVTLIYRDYVVNLQRYLLLMSRVYCTYF